MGRTRKEQARATRVRMVLAAKTEFLQNGYHGTTMAAVAERAGVAIQTVYFVFHTKAALISEVIDAAVTGAESGDPADPEDTEWWAGIAAADTGAEALRVFARGAAPVYERAAGISEVLRAAASADEDVRATFEHHDRLQVAAFRQVIDTVATKGALRAGLDPAEATDVLITVCGDSTYDQLRNERGWSHERVVTWWRDVLPVLLLADPESS